MRYYPDVDKYWNKEMEYILGYLYGFGLDIGCGERTPFPHIICIDKNGDGKRVIKGKGDKLPFSANHFDFVYSGHSLEHFENTVGTLQEWIRVVKPLGYIVIVSPDRRYIPNRHNPAGDPQHRQEWTYEELREITKLLDNVVQVNRNIIALNQWSFTIVLRKTKCN